MQNLKLELSRISNCIFIRVGFSGQEAFFKGFFKML